MFELGDFFFGVGEGDVVGAGLAGDDVFSGGGVVVLGDVLTAFLELEFDGDFVGGGLVGGGDGGPDGGFHDWVSGVRCQVGNG